MSEHKKTVEVGGAKVTLNPSEQIVKVATKDVVVLDELGRSIRLKKPSPLANLDFTKAVGKGANVDGGPFGATAWLANELAKYGRALKAGDYVTTGTAIAPFPYAGDGKTAVADFGALGKVEVRIG